MGELVIAAVGASFGRDMDACFRTIERALQEARVCGAGLVVLPEAALGGYVESLHDDGGRAARRTPRRACRTTASGAARNCGIALAPPRTR